MPEPKGLLALCPIYPPLMTHLERQLIRKWISSLSKEHIGWPDFIALLENLLKKSMEKCRPKPRKRK